MGKTRVRHDDCADRWTCEAQRLVMFRRQRDRTHDDLRHATDERVKDQLRIDRDALDVSIGYTVELMRGIEDEHNGHTVGTWEHAHRPPHVPVSA